MEPMYFYNKQIKSYLAMFIAIFSGLHVNYNTTRSSSEPKLIPVPVIYGSRDRVTAAIMNDNVQTKLVRLPVMSAYMRGFDIARDRMKGSGTIRSSAYVPTGGLLPDDVQSIKQRMPVPYDLTVELGIHASNQDQLLQILEQICMIFDPSVQIERSDAPFDWAKTVVVELTSIQMEEMYPSGTDRRKCEATLLFDVPVWIEVPTTFKNDIVKTIKLRLDATSDFDEWVTEIPGASSDEYDVVATAEDVREDQDVC